MGGGVGYAEGGPSAEVTGQTGTGRTIKLEFSGYNEQGTDMANNVMESALRNAEAERKSAEAATARLRSEERAAAAAHARRLAELDSRRAEAQKFHETNLASERKKSVAADIARLKTAGHLPPAVAPLVERQLLTARTSVIHKFSEGGVETNLSEYDLIVKTWESVPTMFTEQARNSEADKPGSTDYEEQKLVRFTENDKRYAAAGMTTESLLAGFRTDRKINKNITAEEFLNIK